MRMTGNEAGESNRTQIVIVSVCHAEGFRLVLWAVETHEYFTDDLFVSH